MAQQCQINSATVSNGIQSYARRQMEFSNLFTLKDDLFIVNDEKSNHGSFVYNINNSFGEEIVMRFGDQPIYTIVQPSDKLVDKYLNISDSSSVNFELKLIRALQLSPRKKYPSKNVQGFYNDLRKYGTPEIQINILKDYIAKNGITDIDTDELIIRLLSDISYTIEINTSKTTPKYSGGYEVIESVYGRWMVIDGEGNKASERYNSKEEAQKIADDFNKGIGIPTNTYMFLTVPGGTNYTENEISTPDIIPSIKGHAEFATDQGIGWFRSDDKTLEGSYIDNNKNFQESRYRQYLNQGLSEEVASNRAVMDANYENPEDLKSTGIPTKTRRILEVQSDWGQKQRKSSEPDINIKYDIEQIIKDLQKSGDLKIDCN